MKKNQGKYCYLEPDFPKLGYVCNIFITSELFQGIEFISLKPVFRTLTEIKPYVKNLEAETNPENKKDITLEQRCMIMPLIFNRLHPLKKEYWAKPGMQIKNEARRSLFLQVIKTPRLYELLVVPGLYRRKRWEFASAIPFYLNSNSRSIENFFHQSFEVVDIRAKYAAFYRFGELMRYDWDKNEISQPLKTEKNLSEFN